MAGMNLVSDAVVVHDLRPAQLIVGGVHFLAQHLRSGFRISGFGCLGLGSGSRICVPPKRQLEVHFLAQYLLPGFVYLLRLRVAGFELSAFRLCFQSHFFLDFRVSSLLRFRYFEFLFRFGCFEI